jgi:hypothetical protein
VHLVVSIPSNACHRSSTVSAPIGSSATLAFNGAIELASPGRVWVGCIDATGNAAIWVWVRLTAQEVGDIVQ